MKKVRAITKWKPYQGERHDNSIWDSPKDGPTVLYKQLPVLLSIINKNQQKNKSAVYKLIGKEFERLDISDPRLSDSRIGTIISLGRKFGLITKTELGITNTGIYSLNNYKQTIQKQYIKLIFNNPLLKNSKGINLFPIVELFKILKQTEYLTREEVAIFIFSSLKNSNETQKAVNEIFKFRKLSEEDRQKKIKEFLKTHKGNITLGKAPSVGYLFSNLEKLDYFQISEKNIYLTSSSEIDKILDMYKNIEVYDFENDKKLWEIYYTNQKINFPPENIKFEWGQKIDIYFSLNNEVYNSEPISNNKGYIKLPIFKELDNHIEIQNLHDPNQVVKKTYKANRLLDLEKIDLNFTKKYSTGDLLKFYSENDKDPILKLMRKNISSNLKGARFESLVHDFLEENLSHKVVWNGKLDDNNIPKSAPGGNADIIVETPKTFYVVETTTMKNRTGQENAETFSLARHAENFLNKGKKVCIVFISPIKHETLSEVMKDLAEKKNILYKNIDINDLLKNYKDIFI